MKANQILVSLVLLAILLAVTIVGGTIQDESQRRDFGTWIPVAIVVAGMLAWRFAGRSRRTAREPEAQRTDISKEPAHMPANPSDVRHVLLLVAIGSAFVVLSWVCLIYLGSLAGQESQTTALMGIRIATAAGTTATAVLLSRPASAQWLRKAWVIQLSAVLQLVLAFVGLLIMPIVALIVWNGHIDFETYSQKLGFALLLVPMAAVTFCLTRGGGSKK